MINYLDRYSYLFYVLLLVSVLSQGSASDDSEQLDQSQEEYKIESSVLTIVKKLGFTGEQHHIITHDGYNLSIVRVLNPEVNDGKKGLPNKLPILLIHGEKSQGSTWLVYTQNVTGPKDYSKRNFANESLSSLLKEFRGQPIAKTITLLASVLGHEVWVLNRRGSIESLGHVSMQPFKTPYHKTIGYLNGFRNADHCYQIKTDDPLDDLTKLLKEYEEESINPEFWLYSLDPQVKYDVTKSIDHILKVTGHKKIATVGHSTGAALVLMLLSSQPEYTDKISIAISLAPSIYQQHTNDPSKIKGLSINSALEVYQGPYQNSLSTKNVTCLIDQVCYDKYGKRKCTNTYKARAYQIGINKEAAEAAEFLTGERVSARQTAQVHQSIKKGKMYYYDYGSPEKNREKYGQDEPPLYDMGKVQLKNMTFYHGLQDQIAMPRDVRRLIKDLNVPVKDVFINDPRNIFFDHTSCFTHELVEIFVTVPVLKEIEEMESAN